MRKIAIIGLSGLFMLSILFTGCDSVKNANNTQKGAGIGAVAGGIIGAVLGNNLGKGGNAALGAAIGAAVGGGTGALIGNKMDKQAREIDQALPGADVERVGEGIHLVLNENAVRFDLNKATLTSQAKANLDKLIPVFNSYADTNIEIFGYTDSTGKADYNLTLSQKRAESVKTYLISKGLVASRFKTSGFGIADPIASNDTKEGQSQNRRVEFAITANNKMVEDAKKQQ
ncbi:outer membrane protein OmpA-like peptidoglycan-associated protein [Flavobacterium sp. 1]|uniref:OmpA family protein n=1 Tax=Flavobacterium sp. 1 TaxID=2035200 RepID=UPI000C240990|nr:OmpA family protein [Flavobacterium sp. 1]PJJ11033.1 outer membrane protein OmpA-like peptidoglycan-associated protein [Flavobacterium sp. 1]